MSSEAIELRPLDRPPDATVVIPGSKSISNRALLIAALAEGESELNGALFSDDTRYMADALRRLGVDVEAEEERARFRVSGCGGHWPASRADLFVGNAGTAMRFLTAALCLGRGAYRIDGTVRMRERPIGDLVDGLAQLGATVECERRPGCPPLRVRAQGLRGGAAVMCGERSSQFVSAVLMVAAYAECDVTVEVPGTLIARPYVDMTIRVMRDFGIAAQTHGQRFHVGSGRRYRGRAYPIEPDASSAHYFFAAAALTGGRVRVEGLARDSPQGDVRFVEILRQMGARVDWEQNAVAVTGPMRLRGIDVDMNDISDTAPTLAVLGAFADGPVRLRNIAHVRWQESDRLRAVATELQRLGVAVEEQEDGLLVRPSPVRPSPVHTYDDHRIAMSFALAGLKEPGIEILDPGCVAKTFPGYFSRLEELRR